MTDCCVHTHNVNEIKRVDEKQTLQIRWERHVTMRKIKMTFICCKNNRKLGAVKSKFLVSCFCLFGFVLFFWSDPQTCRCHWFRSYCNLKLCCASHCCHPIVWGFGWKSAVAQWQVCVWLWLAFPLLAWRLLLHQPQGESDGGTKKKK